MNPKEFIEEVERRLGQGNAPILYLHRTGQEGPFAAIITAGPDGHLGKLEDLIPDERDAEATDLMMYHSHLEGDEEDWPTDGAQRNPNHEQD